MATTDGARDIGHAEAGHSMKKQVSKIKLPEQGTTLSKRVQAALKQFDVNHDDYLDVNEVTALVEHMVRQEQNNKRLVIAISVLGVFTCLLLGGVFGLVWAVVAALKDNEVHDSGVMTKKGDDTVVVQTAAYEYGVRTDYLAARNTANGSVTGTPLRTAQHTGVRLSWSPLLGTETLMQMNYLVVNAGAGANGTEVLLKVLGVARVMDLTARWGSVVKVMTHVGTISLYDKDDIRFDTSVSTVFEDMGLPTTTMPSGHRRLLAGGNDKDAGASADALVNNVPEDDVIDPKFASFKGLGNNKDRVRDKANKGKALLDKADTGNKGAEAAIMAAYADWKATYDAVDGTKLSRGKSEAARYASFRRAMREVFDLNGGPAAWVSDMNALADMDTGELASIWALAANEEANKANGPPMREGGKGEPAVAADPPGAPGRRSALDTSVTGGVMEGGAGKSRKLLQGAKDWVAEGKVGAVRDQGACGCCYSFAAAGVVESAYLIAYNKGPNDVRLSYAQAAFCCGSKYKDEYAAKGLAGMCSSAGNCNGGSMNHVMNYAALAGLSDESSTWGLTDANFKSLSMVAPGCPSGTFPNMMSPTDAQNKVQLDRGAVAYNAGTGKAYTEAQLMAAVDNGPVAISLNVASDFSRYGSAIYDGVCTTAGNHAVVIVGYNVAEGYWLVRNSWGVGWGENGYIKIRMIGDGLGKCGMYQWVYGFENKFKVALGNPPNAPPKTCTGVVPAGWVLNQGVDYNNPADDISGWYAVGTVQNPDFAKAVWLCTTYLAAKNCTSVTLQKWSGDTLLAYANKGVPVINYRTASINEQYHGCTGLLTMGQVQSVL